MSLRLVDRMQCRAHTKSASCSNLLPHLSWSRFRRNCVLPREVNLVTLSSNNFLLFLITSAALNTLTTLGGLWWYCLKPTRGVQGNLCQTRFHHFTTAHRKNSDTPSAQNNNRRKHRLSVWDQKSPTLKVPGMRVAPGVHDLVRRALDSP